MTDTRSDPMPSQHQVAGRSRAISHAQLLHAYGRPGAEADDAATVIVDLTEPSSELSAPVTAPERELFGSPSFGDTVKSNQFLRGSGERRRAAAPRNDLPTVERGEGPPAGQDGNLPHLPALDGLRGLAVVGVLLFHAGFSWATGGFLGVSTFFTLSGFLITALLLREHRSRGGISLGNFWLRRARRLLPAALASLVLAQIVTLAVGDAGQRKGIGFDTLGALLYGTNWRSVFAGQSYGQLFQAPSPLLHFWSLAVEEQFYLFYPLLVAGVLGVLGWNRRRFIAVLSGLFALSILLMIAIGPALGWSIDRLYYGTDTRMAELLAGALLGAVVAHRIGSVGLRTSRLVGWSIAVLGAIGLVFMFVMWNKADQEAAWLYHGGLAVYAMATVAVVTACILPSGPVRLALSVPPLQFLGRISYGLYLYHWPVFLLLNPARTHLDGWPLFLVRMAITFPIAIASYHLLEMPFRRGVAFRAIRVHRVAPFVVGSLLMIGVVVSLSAPEAANDFASGQRKFEAAKERASQGLPPTSVPTTVAGSGDAVAPAPTGRVPRVAFFGDSTALATGLGTGDYLSSTGQAEPVGGATELGCGIGVGGERRMSDKTEAIPDRCYNWEARWADTVKSTGADLAVVQAGPWDVTERLLPGDTVWRTIGDPTYDAYLLGEMTKAVDTLASSGAHVVWLTSPPVSDRAKSSDQTVWRVPPPLERTARFNDMIKRLPELRPGKVAVVDLASWLAASGRDDELRPDGVHLSDTTARVVGKEYLGKALLDADASLPVPSSR